MKLKILVTGTAGFIGFFTVKRLLERGDEAVGLDNINDYYDVNLKYGRLAECGIEKDKIKNNHLVQSTKFANYRFMKSHLEDRENLFKLFERERFDKVCHLAAQAGVRYSLENPFAYINSNILGFMNILEACRHFGVKSLVYASSSSVYGLNEEMPFSTRHNVDHPISLYAATKKSTELMAHTYSYLYRLPTTGLRFFTVYGPWGRPDMAIFKFVKSILQGSPIDVYNHGNMKRDFTYIDDIAAGIIKTIDHPAQENGNWQGQNPDPSTSPAPYKVYNIGNSSPVLLLDFIETIEKFTGREAQKNMLPMQPGDVPATWADCSALEEDFGYRPNTPIEKGVEAFVSWYKEFYPVRTGER
ncbi:MAG: NAD-dependent epimerase [Candidatus Aminicenantes bacterium]|nr:NAD-dependent epimerase [Candidatus Aminicenantes bacterium]